MDTQIKNFVQQTWESPDRERFPGPQPVSIERRHFGEFSKRPYYVCEKTDGVRHLLLSLEVEGKRFTCLVNRAFEIFPFTTMIPRGTVLDGELVRPRVQGTEGAPSRPVFLIYDAICAKGVDVRKEPLDKRLAAAKGLLKSVIKSSKDPFEIRVKEMTPFPGPLPNLDSFPWETDGLVFTPVNEPVRMGTHETLFKWKPRPRITIDFEVRKGGELNVQEKGRLYKEADLHTGPRFPDGTIVECGYGKVGWYVEKVRTDKTHANNRRTYFRTLVNLRENIQFEEFCNL